MAKGQIMKIAIVHPWFLAGGGAEQTVNALAAIFPDAVFFTMLYTEDGLPSNLRHRTIHASSWNTIPFKYQVYRYLLPLYPLGFESLDLRGYDVVLTSDSNLMKGVLIDQNAIHICYCHSPMRCLWDLRHEYLASMPAWIRPIFRFGVHYVRQWDFSAAQRVDAFIANSENVAERIQTYYRRSSTVVYPPVDTHNGFLNNEIDDYYLSVGRIVDFKRIDLLIQVCNELKRNLVIVGTGRDEKKLRSMAGPTIRFAGRASSEDLHTLYSRCRAFLFAADEDFGIVPVEAQSFGRPVIAYGKGGTLETVIDPSNTLNRVPTGIHFFEQTTASLKAAMLRFEALENSFDPKLIRLHAQKFDTANFAKHMKHLVKNVVRAKRAKPPAGNATKYYEEIRDLVS